MTVAVYMLVPASQTVTLLLGFPLGFFQSGIVAGMGATFAELFPTYVRATGQGFSYNFGRILAAIGGLQTATLMGLFDGSFPKAGSVLMVIYLIGVFVVWLGPETKGKPLPE